MISLLGIVVLCTAVILIVRRLRTPGQTLLGIFSASAACAPAILAFQLSTEASLLSLLPLTACLGGTWLLVQLQLTPSDSLLRAQESEQRFRDFARSCSDNFWEMGADLRFTIDIDSESSPLPFSAIGRTRWEMAGADPETDEYWRRHKADLDAHRPFRDFYYSVAGPDNVIKHWKVSGMPLFSSSGEFRGYRGSATEMTESIEAKQRAQESQRRLYDAIENISEGFILWDADDRVVLCNSRYKEIFSPIREYCVPGSSWEDGLRELVRMGFFSIGDDPVAQEAFIEARKRRRHDPRTEPYTQAVVDDRWLQVIERPTGDGGLVGIWTDVTDIKRREQELAHAHKMELVGQLTGSIAHDFNNFLAVILGNLELLKSRLSDREDLSKFVQRSMRGAQRATALTQRLLAFSRKQSLQPEPTDVTKLITGMRELLQGSAGTGIETKISFDSDLAYAVVDPNQLETALLNLVLNSRDAMPKGGELLIEARNSPALDYSSSSHGTPLENGEFVVISVKDTGSGIPAEIRERVFEPFFTTKDAGKGSGLGLSMVDGFVRQSNGRIRILENDDGPGACVELSLPKANSKIAGRFDVDADGELAQGRGEQILVVEDDPHVRELTVTLLLELGYRVAAVADGPAAIRLLEQQPKEFKLLLSDVVLPLGMSGPEIAERALGICPTLRVLFMSGYPQIDNNDGTKHDITPNLMHKPFRKEELAQRVRAVLDQYEIAVGSSGSS